MFLQLERLVPPIEELFLNIFDLNSEIFVQLYNEDKSELEIEWVPNTSFIFARDETTYHSYKSNGLDVRKTLMINLLG